ncbi:MAG: hypothetical protein J5574_06220 [Lachnospiraceae bacterium]|nr:hypothetical protein [Lachnospiraceae bacterium]
MNKFLNNLERKIGKYAITNLSLYIIIAYGIGYLLALTGNMGFFTLNPYEIFNHYQVWRLITWILVPPIGSNIILALIMLYFYYQIGTVLERTWGTFRYNLYIFSGLLFSVIGALSLYGILMAMNASSITPEVAEIIGRSISDGFNTSYINMSIFLAFAVTYPDMHVLLMFVIPVKMKWMAYFYAVITVYQLFTEGITVRVAIFMSLLNFLVFFFTTRNYKSISPKEMYRKRAFKRATSSAAYGGAGSASVHTGTITKHKCAICGRTEKDSDTLEFRFCSKCNGNYEYCSDHLFSHKHVL